jgi:hypothetical protein
MDSFDGLNPSGDMLTVASRIQERALQLASQRGIRDAAQEELQQIESSLRQEQFANARIRRKFLTEVRTRHGLELELWEIRDQMKQRAECLLNDQERARTKGVEAVNMEGTWKRTIKDVYASHQTQQQIYQRSLESRISIRQQQTKRRERKLEFLRSNTNKFIEEEKSMAYDAERLRQVMEETDRREETEDQEVSNLAIMIKATLTKVRIYRYCDPAWLLMCM